MLTMLILGAVLKRLGWRWTMVIGILGHSARFAVYAFFPNAPAVILVQLLHGVCYAFFFATVYIFVDEYFPKDVRASAQGLFNAVILGIGALVANSVCPYLMQRVFTHDSITNYRGLFLVPLAAATLAAFALALFFRPPPKAQPVAETRAAVRRLNADCTDYHQWLASDRLVAADQDIRAPVRGLAREAATGSGSEAFACPDPAASSSSNCATAVSLAWQHQVWGNFAERLEHETPQVGTRMGQRQLRRRRGFLVRRQSGPGPGDAARSAPSWAGGQTPSPAPAACPATTLASPLRAAPSPRPHSQKAASPADNPPGVVCQSDDLSNGFSDSFSSRLIARRIFPRESPRFDPNATNAQASTVDCGPWTVDRGLGPLAFSI